MRLPPLLPLLLAASLAGCELPGASREIVIQLEEVNDSGVSGTATITPPEGTAQLPFELFVDGIGRGLAAMFLRHGSYVACGEA